MKGNSSSAYRGRIVTGLVAGCLIFVLSTACSKNQQKSSTQPTPDQVRSHSDQTFDKLKQEERNRAGQ